MGLWDAITGGLSKLFGGGGGGASGMAQNAFNNTAGSQGFSGIVSGAGNAGLGGFGSQLGSQAKSAGGGLMGGLSNMFGGSKNLGSAGLGLAGMLGSQLIPNPKQPALGADYNQYMGMMKQGGTPGMQSANQYYQGVLSGTNQDAYEAAAYSLDNNYEDEVRKLTSMYKSLRPGTDPATDSTYQRDLASLNDQYARARAQTMAQVQQGAASGMAGLGQSQMQGFAQGLQPQIDQGNNAYTADLQKKQMLMSGFTGIGQNLLTNALDPNQAMYKTLLSRMFGGK